MEFELTHPEPPPTLPVSKMLTSTDDLVGHTIRAVFDGPNGERKAEMVIVTETGCWLALQAEAPDACGDDADILVCKDSAWSAWGNRKGELCTLADFVSPIQLHLEGIISSSELEYLNSAKQQRDAKRNAERAARLRAEAARLEGGAA